MRKIFFIFLSVVFLSYSVYAIDVQKELMDTCGVDSLEAGLSWEEQRILGDISPDKQTDFWQALMQMLENAFRSIGKVPRETTVLLCKVILVILLCQMVDAIGNETILSVSRISGCFAVTSLCITNLSAMIGLGGETIERMTQYAKLLLPVMASAAVASGAATGSGILYTVTVAASNIFLSFSNQVLLPSIYAYIGLSLADCVLQQERLKRLRELMKWLMELGLKGIGYGFAAIVSLTGVLSGNVDALAMKGVKTAISTVVPVVGGIISGAADAVINGAALLKNTIGAYGMLAILAIMLLPFLQLGISWILFRLLSALCGMMDSKLSGLIESVSGMMGLLLGMIGCCAWIMLLSCCCYLKVVSV